MTASDAVWQGTARITAAEIATALGQHEPTLEQRAVIEAQATPALVVAGAGSGKTETMAARVVWLVANGHVRREEVLGLTFTRKAAGELAERITQRLDRIDEYAQRGLVPLIPELVASGALATVPQDATERRALLDRLAKQHGVGGDESESDAGALLLRPRVSTYNAFADALVREHAARIGRDSEAALLSESAAWLLARRVVLTSSEEALADLDKSPNTLAGLVMGLAGAALDHRAELGEVADYGDAWVADLLPHLDRDRNPGAPEKAAEAVGGLALIARLAAEYGRAKAERGVFDYADQVAGALDVVEQSPDVAEQLRSQYRVVLLDEYQDTSVLQAQLLAAIFTETPVMAVGDPNQAIYSWRGASANNLFAFERVFSPSGAAKHFDLSVSWRNDRRILDAANALLAGRSENGARPLPPLTARADAGPGRVCRVYPETIDEEAAAVAEWFAELHARHIEAGGALAAHSGAILFRAKTHMTLFAEALAARGIPHRVLGLGGLLRTPEVTDVVSVLRVIDDPAQGSALIRILAGPRFAVGVADLAALHTLAKTLSRRDEALAPLDAELLARIRGSAGIDEAVSIIDAVEFLRTSNPDYRLLDGFTDAGKQRLREAGEMFARLRLGARAPLPELLRQIENELRLDIELAVNEARGPAHRAMGALRAFGEEVRSFLASSERETIGALLSWLDHAETQDDLRPRPEPPEPGVVQLLTIHGAKGLEWDAVAAVRWVHEELPALPRSLRGWMSLGQLPDFFRKDRDALPRLVWDATEPPDRKTIDKAMSAYSDAMRDYLEAEERRLAYVAVTRARSDLLLSGSWWATQTKSRKPSDYLTTVMAAVGLEDVSHTEFDVNPRDAHAHGLSWPQDPLGSRRAAVEEAAAFVHRVGEARPTPELALILAEREARRTPPALRAPTRIPASRFKDYLGDFAGTVQQIVRPMPERPYPQTALGTLFHSWVEQRYGSAGAASLDDALWESDEEGGAVVASPGDSEELARLQDAFERSEWATRAPIEVESEIHFPLVDPADGSEHIVICKLDAVFETDDGRIEIVDWKTGKAPATAQEREERMVQLALYRLAYHRHHGVPLERIDVALCYLAHDLVIREENPYSEAELLQRWSAARAAR